VGWRDATLGFKFIRDWRDKLYDLDKESRRFMKSCDEISNKLGHEFTLDRRNAYWTVPLFHVLCKAREGAAIWDKSKQAVL